jgi:hypothetical protein
MTCPQQYQYQYILRIVPTIEQRSALDFGTAIHAGLETWYGSGMPGVLDDVFDAFLSELPEGHDETAKETERSGYGEVMLRRYVEHWAETDRKLISKVHLLENPLRVTMPEGMPDLIGKPDMVVERPDGWWLFDHKTMAATEHVSDYIRLQEMNFAWRIYTLAAREKGYPVQGVMLNMLRKMVIPGEVDEAGRKRRKGKLADWMPFERERLVVSDTMLEIFKKTYAQSCKVLHLYESSGIFPQHPTGCRKFNRICPYIGLCNGFPLEVEDWGERERDYVDEINEGRL